MREVYFIWSEVIFVKVSPVQVLWKRRWQLPLTQWDGSLVTQWDGSFVFYVFLTSPKLIPVNRLICLMDIPLALNFFIYSSRSVAFNSINSHGSFSPLISLIASFAFSSVILMDSSLKSKHLSSLISLLNFWKSVSSNMEKANSTSTFSFLLLMYSL